MDTTERSNRKSLVKRLLWFTALWLAGVATLGVIALLLKLLIGS